MQSGELLSFCQGHMAQAYVEQVWAVALMGGMCSLVIVQAQRLITALTVCAISWGIRISAILALLFIWSRHGIYLYYSTWSRQIIVETPSVWPTIAAWEDLLRLAAGWSGVIFYTLIIFGMSYAALRVLANQAGKNSTKEPEKTKQKAVSHLR